MTRITTFFLPTKRLPLHLSHYSLPSPSHPFTTTTSPIKFPNPTLQNPSPELKPQTHLHLLSLINSCTHKTHFVQIHSHLLCTSLLHFPSFSSSFLSRVALSSLFPGTHYSRLIFKQIKNPSAFLYNAMIRAYSVSDSPVEGLRLFREMRQAGLRAGPMTLSFVMKCLIEVSSLFGGVQIHTRALRDGFQSDCVLLTDLIRMYADFGKDGEACKVFDEITQRDTVAWNVLISCYLRNNRARDVLHVFDGMVSGEFGREPDDVTCLFSLQACANLGALEFGERVHGYIEERGFGRALNLCNSLIAMYSRCGCLEKAWSIFQGMQNKNVVTWSAMVFGFAINGYGREAVDAFREMHRMGMWPDDHTFTGVLCACSHCGFVDEGRMFFGRMRKEFGIVPNICHYGCMVDLLGRAGQLHEAYQLIKSMEVRPDATVWRSLLGACRIHRNIELGERAIRKLIELKAQNAGDYVLLLNTYASVGNWEKVKELRMFMKEKGIHTVPGNSSMALQGEVHEFIADDISHPKKDQIYEMLDEINKQLKVAGYVPEITSELHNVDAEEKRFVLSYHSEKLAIAFAILVTPPGTTIRIVKNLRTCLDCHNFAKVISVVYSRQVSIRDRARFHHFREGCCSCGDYW